VERQLPPQCCQETIQPGVRLPVAHGQQQRELFPCQLLRQVLQQFQRAGVHPLGVVQEQADRPAVHQLVYQLGHCREEERPIAQARCLIRPPLRQQRRERRPERRQARRAVIQVDQSDVAPQIAQQARDHLIRQRRFPLSRLRPQDERRAQPLQRLLGQPRLADPRFAAQQAHAARAAERLLQRRSLRLSAHQRDRLEPQPALSRSALAPGEGLPGICHFPLHHCLRPGDSPATRIVVGRSPSSFYTLSAARWAHRRCLRRWVGRFIDGVESISAATASPG
jgi:hypothetical protein